MRNLRLDLCASFLLLAIIKPYDLSAQVFPIQSAISIMPPYSARLSDYTEASSQQLRIQIRSNDPTITNYKVRLRISIEGLNITVRSKANFYVDPITIDGSSPILLTGAELLPYLNPENLDFVGYSKSDYKKNGRLPDGVYRFSIEVVDYNRGTVVSNKAFVTVWCILNDPVLLALPANNAKHRVIDPTNIAFTWTPRHKGSVNSAFTCEYVFRLVEVSTLNRNPNDAMLTHPALFETVTTNSQFLYGPSEPQLIPGRTYAWQVIVRDVMGRDLFRNDGRSEVFVFQFGDAIASPENLRQEYSNGNTISLRWEPPVSGAFVEKFRIQYRRSGTANWFESVTANTWITLTDLTENTTYEVRIRSEDLIQSSEYSSTHRFETTTSKKIEGYECGGPMPKPDSIKNTSPLLKLLPGDVFRCYDLNVTVQQVTSSLGDGTFIGFGWQRVNFFNGANIYVEFNGKINSQYVLVSGRVRSSSDHNVMSSLIEEMKAIGENRKIAAETQDSTEVAVGFEPYLIDGVVDSIAVLDNKIIIIDEEGKEYTYENKAAITGEPVVIKGTDGTIYTVEKDGTIQRSGINLVNNAAPKTIDTSKLDDYELLVKEVIDSLYGVRVSYRDSLLRIKNTDQKTLDGHVATMESIEESVVNEVPQIELDISVVELMTEIELMDSVVQISVDLVNANEGKLSALNKMLDEIKTLTAEIDKKEKLKDLGILQRRLKISMFIENRLR